MSILFSNEIFAAICDELQTATDSVQIMSAYGKRTAIAAIIENVQPIVKKKRIMLRFRLDDILKGSTDFDVLDYCRNQGWDVYIRFDLHAKTYIVDNKRGIIGSANATASGLAMNSYPNFEMAALVDIEQKDIQKIKAMFDDALLVTDDLWNELYIELQNHEIQQGGVSHQWSSNITSKFMPHINALFSHEFPDVNQYKQGDYVQFLDIRYSGNLEDIKMSLRWSPAYLWLLDELSNHEGEMYFGELSAHLHNVIVSDPKPYRKDVKQLLANLLALIQQVDMDEIGVDRPNYSQRVFLK